MDYNKIYNSLIESRMKMKDKRIECKKRGEYFEIHHIILKCKGGTNDKNNLVLLTSREHFLAHWILWLIYRDRQTALGFHKMMSCNKNQKRIISSRGYAEAREAYRLTNLGNQFGKGRKNTITEEMKKNQSLIMKGRYSGKKNPYYGKKHSEEMKIKLSTIAKERFKNNPGTMSKIVLDVNTGVFYNSGKEAAFYYNIKPSTLKSMLNGYKRNKTSLIYT